MSRISDDIRTRAAEKRAEELHAQGQQSFSSEDFPGAENSFAQSLISDPHQSNAWADMGLVASRMNMVNSAIAMTEKAIANDRLKVRGVSWCNLGNLQVRIGKLAEAAESFGKALDLGYDGWELRVNRGIMYLTLSDPEHAIPELEKALTLETPEDKVEEVVMNLGYAYTMSGDLLKGLHMLPSIWTIAPKEIGDISLPAMTYYDQLKGQRVLLFHNQGYGDTIQFARFMPAFLGAAIASGGSVVIAVPRPIVSLLKGQPWITSKEGKGGGVEVCDIAEVSKYRDYVDCCLSISMLPLWYKTTLNNIPSSPYITPVVEAGATAISSIVRETSGNSLKVGVAWAARHDHGTGLRRSIPFEEILSLLTLPRTKFFSLQAGTGPAVQDIDRLGAMYLIERCRAKDFNELSQLISEMDFIVSADTSPLHLAGAMGKPTLGLMSRDGSDWRWLAHNTTTTPWYPSVQLIRQQEVNQWKPVIQEAREYLSKMTAFEHITLEEREREREREREHEHVDCTSSSDG